MTRVPAMTTEACACTALKSPSATTPAEIRDLIVMFMMAAGAWFRGTGNLMDRQIDLPARRRVVQGAERAGNTLRTLGPQAYS
ncbi:hypothetical protein CBM2587_B90242 [Cupriavidus taiwanensis]|uniref:Transposase n=1 Tax=Cupriavidus taiwanensis TaxID=164546 RepID=A0A375CCI2_9BURK|nr:hypothetical protein CBM2587_B90242 [Cupriavidus taiwanensis]